MDQVWRHPFCSFTKLDVAVAVGGVERPLPGSRVVEEKVGVTIAP